MAKKKAKKPPSSSASLVWMAFTTIASLIGGGGVTGWLKPDMPVLGPGVAALGSSLGSSLGFTGSTESTAALATGPATARAAVPAERLAAGPAPAPPLASIAYAPAAAAALRPVTAMPPASPPPPAVPLPAGPPAAGPPAAPAQAALSAPPTAKPSDAVLIASFNIQVFGEAKLAKPQVVDVLARVVRTFDIVAIQEVRAKSDSVIPTFVAAVNADGSRYHHVIGPRQGRTVSKEQYTFIYDTNRIEIDPTSVGSMRDPADRLHRPPMYARFRVRTSPPELGFSFWMIDTHTDPDEVPQEVDALADVFTVIRSARPDEDDVILLGDLNAGPPQFGRIKQIPGVAWAISGVTTNTRRTKTYDNLIFDRTATGEYTGRWGVVDLQNTFGLSIDKALEVSDHNPVWAAFSPWELRPPLQAATAPRDASR